MSKINFERLSGRIGKMPGVLSIKELTKDGKVLNVSLTGGEKADYDDLRQEIVPMLPAGVELQLTISKKWDIGKRLSDPTRNYCDESYGVKK